MKRYIAVLIMVGITVVATGVYAMGDPAAGEAVYNKSCKMCHGTGMMNAPKVGDSAAWKTRIEKGEAALLDSALKGIGKMPARGGCSSCSDDDLQNAIAYMMSQSR